MWYLTVKNLDGRAVLISDHHDFYAGMKAMRELVGSINDINKRITRISLDLIEEEEFAYDC